MIQLLVYGLIAAALIGGAIMAWSGFKDHIGAPYAQAQMAADQVVVSKANAAQKAAESERDAAQADNAACVRKSNVQSEEVLRWQTAAAANLKAAREAKARASKEATDAAPKIADLELRAAAAPKLMACAVELDAAKKTMADTIRARRGVH